MKRNLSLGQWDKSLHPEKLDHRFNDILPIFSDLTRILSKYDTSPVYDTFKRLKSDLKKLLKNAIDKHGKLVIHVNLKSLPIADTKREAEEFIDQVIDWLDGLFGTNMKDMKKHSGLFSLAAELLDIDPHIFNDKVPKIKKKHSHRKKSKEGDANTLKMDDFF